MVCKTASFLICCFPWGSRTALLPVRICISLLGNSRSLWGRERTPCKQHAITHHQLHKNVTLLQSLETCSVTGQKTHQAGRKPLRLILHGEREKAIPPETAAYKPQ